MELKDVEPGDVVNFTTNGVEYKLKVMPHVIGSNDCLRCDFQPLGFCHKVYCTQRYYEILSQNPVSSKSGFSRLISRIISVFKIKILWQRLNKKRK